MDYTADFTGSPVANKSNTGGEAIESVNEIECIGAADQPDDGEGDVVYARE